MVSKHSLPRTLMAAVAEWYRYRTVACFATGSRPVPLKTRRVGQRCTLNLSRAETSSRWCGVVVRRGGCQLRPLCTYRRVVPSPQRTATPSGTINNYDMGGRLAL
ncbi:uncharacterized protein TNCV_1208381 [Trichonephila clavipes]|nr:uncharacterized protein TNCV_1208381 [Trichonephila clavipes]